MKRAKKKSKGKSRTTKKDEETDEDERQRTPGKKKKGTPVKSSKSPSKTSDFQHEGPVEEWTEDDVADWLKSLDLGHLEDNFRSEHVNGHLLLTCDDTLLKEDLNVEKRIQRNRILGEVIKLKK